MTDFATNPGALVTPMTAGEMLDGLECGTLSIGQLNWAFQELFAVSSAEKYVVGYQNYNAATNTAELLMNDGSTVAIDFTTLIADAVATVVAESKPGMGAFRPYNRNAVACWIGDSNTTKLSYLNGASATLYGAGGPFDGWTIYNSAANGSLLRNWVNSIGAGLVGAPPLDGDDATRNVWRVKNADPDEVMVMLGTNDIRKLGVGQTYLDLAAAEAGMGADLLTLVNWLVANTKARIELQIPPPLTYVAGSVSGFADFVDANDAAARNAAMRRIYRAFRGWSSRVEVLDLHKVYFPSGTADAAMRWDSVAASQDPDLPAQLLAVDELHHTPWGAVRRAQAMHKRRNQHLPYSLALQFPWVALHQGGAKKSLRAIVKAVGVGFIDIYSSTTEAMLGVLYTSTLRVPLDRNPRANDLWAMGMVGALVEMLRSTQIKIYDSAAAVTTITPLSIAHNIVDGHNGDFWRITVAGTPTTALGLADLYVDDVNKLPPMPALFDPIVLDLQGASVSARAIAPVTNRVIALSTQNIQVVRHNAPDAATFDVYYSNGGTGNMDAIDPAYDAAAPGLLMGTLTLAINDKMNSTWAPSVLGAALGGLPPAHGYPHLSVYAVKTSGTIGDYAKITIKSG